MEFDFQPLTYFYSPIDLFAIVGPSELDVTYYYRKEDSFHSFKDYCFRI